MQGARLYDAKRYYLYDYIKTYLALANVPMWHYGFTPSFLQILPISYAIHNPLSSLSRTITTCKLLMLAFGPLNSPPLKSNTENKDISSTREGQTL